MRTKKTRRNIWYEKNRQKILEANKQKRQSDPAWRAKANAVVKNWRAKNPGYRPPHEASNHLKWYHAHRDEINARKRWRRANDEEYRKRTNAISLAFQNGPYATKRRIVLRKHKYGLTEQEFADLVKQHNGLCAICNRRKKLVIDHCHLKNKVRGLLCVNCNWGIGSFSDNIEFLKRAIRYLKTA